jgi:glycosyltransferase involved in cell wall biosynthesis
MPRRNALPHDAFDVVVYAPWASGLVGGSSFEGVPGGTEVQLYQLAKGLAARGLCVGMILMGGATELPASAGGIRILRQPVRRRTRGPLARVGLALGALRSMARVRTGVLIQMNAGPTTAVAALAARIGGARFIYSSASVVDFEFGSHEPRAVNVWLYDRGVRQASEVVVQNGEQARLCRAKFGRDPIVIKSIASRAETLARRPEALLWVGRLQELKQPDAYLELARKVPEAQFRMIAVPQPDEPAATRRRVEDAARELPNLELLEPRSRAGVGQLLDRTVAVVNTSDLEGLPNVFLEGWARGVPALSLSFDPDGLIAAEGLGLFAEGDPTRLEEQARQLWIARDDRAELAERCAAYIQAEHDPDAVVDRWLSVIAPDRALRDATSRAG